ncbi:MAG: ribonuclease J [Alphaproteobacteria bacterium]
MTGGRGREALFFLPLGGAGEIGMNLNLYGYAGKWLMVDLGLTFGDHSTPGVDLIVPDPSFVVGRRSDLVGLVLTHAHEDHLGAVPYLWPRLRCPVYATPFAAAVLRRKLEEGSEGIEALEVTEVPLGARFEVGPFALEYISLTHSIPEPNALAIRTSLGTVLHTGDWKLDPEPLVGGPADEAALRRYGEEGVLAMVCDSTNVLRPGESGSEAAVRESLIELVGRYAGRVAVTTFATNVARIRTVAAVAEAHGRSLALVGRSLRRITEAARETGYLGGVRPFLTDRDAAELPADKVLYLCTGCQGEPNAALSRVAARDHPYLRFGPGDVVIFSSKIIPGNERAIFRLHNELIRNGAQVVSELDHFVHVSGHPSRDELARLYGWVRPKIAVPVHGEMRHLVEHARLARKLKVPQAVVVEDGDLLRLAPGAAEIVERVAVGRMAVDGGTLVGIDGEVLRGRRKLMREGAAFVSVVVNGEGDLIAEPRVSTHGVFDGGGQEGELQEVGEDVRAAIEALPDDARRDDEALREAAHLVVRRSLRADRNKRPVIDIQVVRLAGTRVW